MYVRDLLLVLWVIDTIWESMWARGLLVVWANSMLHELVCIIVLLLTVWVRGMLRYVRGTLGMVALVSGTLPWIVLYLHEAVSKVIALYWMVKQF